MKATIEPYDCPPSSLQEKVWKEDESFRFTAKEDRKKSRAEVFVSHILEGGWFICGGATRQQEINH